MIDEQRLIGALKRNEINREFVLDFSEKMCGVKVDRSRIKERGYDYNLSYLLDHRQVDVSPNLEALCYKVEHLVMNRGGIKPAVEMLHSFRRGTKRLRSNRNSSNHDEQYEWTYTDGNEKFSHRGNLARGHFRWNRGGRYTLTKQELNMVSKFITPYANLFSTIFK